jgi:hypothetical protein
MPANSYLNKKEEVKEPSKNQYSKAKTTVPIAKPATKPSAMNKTSSSSKNKVPQPHGE